MQSIVLAISIKKYLLCSRKFPPKQWKLYIFLLFMAFVFRSQNKDRYQTKPSQYGNQVSTVIENFVLQKQLTKQLKKRRPLKGLVMTSNITNKSQSQNCQLSLIYKQQQKSSKSELQTKPITKLDCRQHFFKSSLPRNMFSQKQNVASEYQQFCIDKEKVEEITNEASLKYSVFTDSKLKVINKSVLSVFQNYKKKGPTPSIPQKRNKYGYVLDRSNNSLSLPKLVSHFYFEGTNISMPGPADYDAKKISKKSPMFNFPKEHIKPQKTLNAQNTLLEQTSIVKKQRIKKVCKIPKTRDTFQRSLSSSESQQSQYQQNCVPGPGEYEISSEKPKDFRSKKESIRKIFFQKMPRFTKNIQQFHEISLVNESPKMKIKHNSQPFLTKCPRIKPQQQKQQLPGPGYYENRTTMQHQTINKLLKSSNYCGFVSKDQRFVKKNWLSPGPGQYYEDYYAQQIIQQKDKCTANFKPKIKDQIKQSLTIKQVKKQTVIHSLKDKIQQIQPQRPGFGSYSPKSVAMQKQKSFGSPHKDLVKKPSEKIEENKYPFNNSARKSIEKPLGEGVGVGSYETQKDWNIKSFNVLFH